MRFVLAVLVFMSSTVHAEYLVNPSFEIGTGYTPPGIPHAFGFWGYDLARFIGVDQGITPFDGIQMLQFVGTLPQGYLNPSHNTGSETIQLFDLTTMPDYSSSTSYSVTVTGFFNRVTGNDQTDTLFDITVGGWMGSPSDFSNVYSVPRIFKSNQLESDGDPLTWEPITTTIKTLPGNTYISVRLAAVENVLNNGHDNPPEFDGHYADKVSMTITAVPEASSIVMLSTLAVASLGLRFRRR